MKQPLSLKGRALALLAQREHSRSELRRKLLRHASASRADGSSEPEPEPEQVDALLDWLEQQGYLSAERFVESRVHVRAARFGNLRIRQELAEHGLSLPPETAEALRASELDRARAVWQRKFGVPPSSAAERARQMRFLAARGFSADVIRRVVP